MRLPVFFYWIFPLSLACLFCYGLGEALGPLAGSFFLAFLFFPVVVKLETFKINRSVATLSVLAFVLLLLVLVLSIAIPPIIKDAAHFFHALPEIVRRSYEQVATKAEDFGYTLAWDSNTLVAMAKKYGSQVGITAIKSITKFLSGTFSGVAKGLIGIINIFLFPVFFYYVINDYERITEGFFGFLPEAWRGPVKEMWGECNGVFSAFIRGQLIVAAILGICYALGLTIIGVKFGAVIGLATGLLGLIPYVGFTVGFLTSITVALAYGAGFGIIVAVIVLFAVVQVIEGFVITPRVVGDKVGLSPLSTMLVLIIGGNLAGMVGMFLAIPMGGILKRLVIRFKNNLQQNADAITG